MTPSERMTPEEILIGLKIYGTDYCDDTDCDTCEYKGKCNHINHHNALSAAASLIEALTLQLAEKDAQIAALRERAEKAEAELKEAVEQMRGVYDHCAHCAYCECKTDEEPCCSCANASNWKWLGARKEGKDG